MDLFVLMGKRWAGLIADEVKFLLSDEVGLTKTDIAAHYKVAVDAVEAKLAAGSKPKKKRKPKPVDDKLAPLPVIVKPKVPEHLHRVTAAELLAYLNSERAMAHRRFARMLAERRAGVRQLESGLTCAAIIEDGRTKEKCGLPVKVGGTYRFCDHHYSQYVQVKIHD